VKRKLVPSASEQLWDLIVQVTQSEAEHIVRTGRIPDEVRMDIERAAGMALTQEQAERLRDAKRKEGDGAGSTDGIRAGSLQ
jgi:hypothetical protein